ncbi:MAG: methyltransferase domain-containing protein [Candidatus Thermoplasmatota archaeon]|nr:methyltransferase domain-containing protein [Candidatus Thermoplasmatota archaeon]
MIEEGTRVILWKKDDSTLIEVDGETKKISGIGVVDTERFIGKEWGSVVELGREEYRLFRPAIRDAPEFFERDAQVILPRVAVKIALYCDISNGKKVVEGGAGSGMLSTVLLNEVGPEGQVITYELRKDFIKTAEANLERLDLTDRWRAIHGDVTEDVKEEKVDAFVVDIPEAWEAVKMAKETLKNGGFFAAYIPSTNQLKKTVKEMRKHDFTDIKSFESLEREMVVREKGVRPSFDMLGHTGYVAVGRKTPSSEEKTS